MAVSISAPGDSRAREYERASKAQEKRGYESAIDHYKKALAIDPQFCAARNDLGVIYLMTDHVDLAIGQFNQVITIDPHAAKPYSNLAVAYLMQNQYEAAERAARQQVRLDHAGTVGRLMLGFSLVLQNKFTPEAEQSLKKATADFPQANLMLALVLAAKGEIERAKDHIQRYLASGDKSAVDLANEWMQQLNSASQTKQ